jgi:hypothetical protein
MIASWIRHKARPQAVAAIITIRSLNFIRLIEEILFNRTSGQILEGLAVARWRRFLFQA